MKSRLTIIVGILLIVFIFSCKKEEDKQEPPVIETPSEEEVNFNLDEVPYPALSDYKFFLGDLKNLNPNNRVIPYDVITPLFSDYAKKKKFIWMPQGVSATYNGDHELLNFPDGTVMVKNFYYDNVQPENERKIIETRLLYKKNGEWKFAEYVWNDEQTEATFDLAGQIKNIEWINEANETQTVNYRIPSEVECFTCHKKNNISSPIGPKPQNINRDFTYSNGTFNQLDFWREQGMLSGELPATISTVVDWTDTNQSLKDRVRAYVDMNCAHCHREGSHCDYRPIRLAWSETTNDQNLGVCVAPQEFVAPALTHIIARGNVNRSMMYFRLNTTELQYRMPLLGRTVIHEEAVSLFNQYITSLGPACP